MAGLSLVKNIPDHFVFHMRNNKLPEKATTMHRVNQRQRVDVRIS
jgi:hypothetical protein